MMLNLRFGCWLQDQQWCAANSYEGGYAKTLNGGTVENAKPLLRLLTALRLPAFVDDYSGFMSRQCWSYDQHLFDWRGLHGVRYFYFDIGCCVENVVNVK